MISLQTNADSINAQNNLSINGQMQSQTIQQLTSGYRINRSGDDAAGLAVANQYRDNIAEMNQGLANANDGVSQLQIIDGGLSNISTILDRMKTLATQSASTTFTGNRATLDAEFQSLVGEITRQATNIGLNSGGTNATNLGVYVGGAASSANAVVNVDLSGQAVDASASGLNLSSSSVTSSANALASIASINSAISTLGSTQGAVGAGENTLEYAINLLQSQITNTSSAESQIRDANIAADASNLTKSQVLVQTSVAALAQANSEPQSVLKLLQG